MGIEWNALRYHKRLSVFATGFDAFRGILVGAILIKRHSIGIVYARSYVAALIGLVLKRLFGVRFVFDTRGLWVDERVDGGVWKKGGLLYRVGKWFEMRYLLEADRVVAQTHAAISAMQDFSYPNERRPSFEKINNCADLDLFRLPVKKEQLPFTVGYVGSVGVWYRFDDALRCFLAIKKRIPGARIHIVNRGGHEYIFQRLAALGVDASSVLVESLERQGVAAAMQRMDIGVFFYKQAFPMKGTAPTKLGEFLGCGVPCLSNTGVGDIAPILGGEQVGVVLSTFDDQEIEIAVEQMIALANDPTIATRCRLSAEIHFSLADGARAYERIYDELDAV